MSGISGSHPDEPTCILRRDSRRVSFEKPLYRITCPRRRNLALLLAKLLVEALDGPREHLLVGVLVDLAVLVVRPQKRLHSVSNLFESRARDL